jgi:hypothetical protein
MLDGATKDQQSITADWTVPQRLIDGVAVKEVRNVPKDSGLLTEVFRRDWDLGDTTVDQVFQVTLFPGAISAWHTHRHTIVDTVHRLYSLQNNPRRQKRLKWIGIGIIVLLVLSYLLNGLYY